MDRPRSLAPINASPPEAQDARKRWLMRVTWAEIATSARTWRVVGRNSATLARLLLPLPVETPRRRTSPYTSRVWPPLPSIGPRPDRPATDRRARPVAGFEGRDSGRIKARAPVAPDRIEGRDGRTGSRAAYVETLADGVERGRMCCNLVL